MSDVVVSTPNGNVTVPTNDATEVDSEWLNSLFVNLQTALSEVKTEQVNQSQQIALLSTRLPENLTELVESQQRTITNLVKESQETLRSLLTPQTPVPEVIPEVTPPAVVENVVMQEPVAEPVKSEVPKRRKI